MDHTPTRSGQGQAELCAFSESHQNQLGMLSCPECTPFGYEPKEDVSDGGDVSDLSK